MEDKCNVNDLFKINKGIAHHVSAEKLNLASRAPGALGVPYFAGPVLLNKGVRNIILFIKRLHIICVSVRP